MKGVLEHQKMWSLLVALGLAVLITIFAAFNSFGETTIADLNDEDRVEMEILERAYADVKEDMIIEHTKQTVQIEKIKIFNDKNVLVAEAVMQGNKVVVDKNVQVLLNRADFLTQSGDTSIYRITE